MVHEEDEEDASSLAYDYDDDKMKRIYPRCLALPGQRVQTMFPFLLLICTILDALVFTKSATNTFNLSSYFFIIQSSGDRLLHNEYSDSITIGDPKDALTIFKKASPLKLLPF